MAKQKPTLQQFKDISFIIFILTVTFSAGGMYVEMNQRNKQLAKLNYNFDNLIMKLKILKIIPENFCKIENEKPFTICDAKIPKRRKNTRRIANDETATNKKEDFETLITE